MTSPTFPERMDINISHYSEAVLRLKWENTACEDFCVLGGQHMISVIHEQKNAGAVR
jgi:hypothetical protein